jgi:hypothetical protein
MKTSSDGYTWSDRKYLSFYGKWGSYSASRYFGDQVGLIFNVHPGGIGNRTNLYYMETSDFGQTWQNANGATLNTPLESMQCPALVRDYWEESNHTVRVWPMDIGYDAQNNPVILYLTGPGETGCVADTRQWMIAHWTGEKWLFHEVTTSHNSYDHGSLFIEADGTWRIIGPTDPGIGCHTGGYVVVWISTDQGETWQAVKKLTEGSDGTHTYVRFVHNGHPDFYAFWADRKTAPDGNWASGCISRFYFASKSGGVWQLPYDMTEDFQKPIQITEPDISDVVGPRTRRAGIKPSQAAHNKTVRDIRVFTTSGRLVAHYQGMKIPRSINQLLYNRSASGVFLLQTSYSDLTTITRCIRANCR